MVLESLQENLSFEPYGTVLSQLNPPSPLKVNSGCWIHEPPPNPSPLPLFSSFVFVWKSPFRPSIALLLLKLLPLTAFCQVILKTINVLCILLPLGPLFSYFYSIAQKLSCFYHTITLKNIAFYGWLVDVDWTVHWTVPFLFYWLLYFCSRSVKKEAFLIFFYIKN